MSVLFGWMSGFMGGIAFAYVVQRYWADAAFMTVTASLLLVAAFVGRHTELRRQGAKG